MGSLILTATAIIDSLGSLIVLGLSVYLFWHSYRTFQKNRYMPIFRFFMALSAGVLIFSISRGTSHLARRILYAAGYRYTWDLISPITSGVNSLTFIILATAFMLFPLAISAQKTLNDSELSTQELKKLLSYKNSVFNSVTSPLFILNAQGKIVEGNRLFLEKNREELEKGKIYCYQLFHRREEICSEDECPMKKALKSGRSLRRVHTHYIGGEERIISITYSPITDEETIPGEVLVIEHDITEQVKKERELIDLLRKLENANQDWYQTFDTIPYPISVQDTEHNILRANRAFFDYFGISPKDLGRGIKCYHIVHHRMSPPEECPHEEAVKGGKLIRTEVNCPEIGKVFDLIVTPVMEEGKTTRTVQVFHDITEMKKAQEERERLERQLFQAQKLESLGILSGGIAHDFNNILMSVEGCLPLLRKEIGQNKRAARFLETISSAVERGSELTRQILIFSRKQPIEKRQINICECIGETVSLLKHTLPENISIVYEPLTEKCVTMIDPSYLNQVLLNLGTNAKDAMPDGGELRISISVVEITRENAPHVSAGTFREGKYACIQVKDSGTGIPEEIIDKIFDPFFTTKEPGKGTGLGLSLVYTIVKEAGGFIHVESKVGEGTTFNVYFPLVDPNLDTPDIALQDSRPDQERKRKGRILLVEDDPMVREVLKEILKEGGFEVTTSANGNEALELIRSGANFDLILSDYMMPGPSGLSLCEKAKKDTPGIRFVLISGYGEEISPETLENAEVDLYLQKPVKGEKLIEELSRLISEKR